MFYPELKHSKKHTNYPQQYVHSSTCCHASSSFIHLRQAPTVAWPSDSLILPQFFFERNLKHLGVLVK